MDPTGFVGPLAYGLKHRQGQQPSEQRPGGAPPRLGASSWGESPELYAALRQQRDRATLQCGNGGGGGQGMPLPPRAAAAAAAAGHGGTPRRLTAGDVAPRSPAMALAAAAAVAAGLRSPLASAAAATSGRSPLNTRYARATTDCAPLHRSPSTSARSPPTSARSPMAAAPAATTAVVGRAPVAAGEGTIGRATGDSGSEDRPLMQRGGVAPSPRNWL